MLYLMIQTFSLMALTAIVFFALGYVFHRRFYRARVVVSEQPPANPPPPPQKHSEEMDKIIADLQSRLQEKERDIAHLLENVKEAESAEQLLGLEETEVERLTKERDELRTHYEDQVLQNKELDQRRIWLETHLKEMETQYAEAEARAQSQAIVDTQNRELLSSVHGELSIVKRKLDLAETELEAKAQQISSYQKRVESLEAQVFEQESVLRQRIETEDQKKETESVEAIWSDGLELGSEDFPQPLSTPVDLKFLEKITELETDLARKETQLQNRSERLEREFREKIARLEGTIENLRNENEMALMTALELAKKPEPSQPVFIRPEPEWHPEPSPITKDETEQLVQALWRQEQQEDAEKERLRKSVEDLRRALDEKEKAIETLGNQIDDLSGKIAPELTGPDDLELIKGVGPAVRKMLSEEFGIKTFEQVAKITKKELEKISKHLFFKNKIEREDWLGQARALHYKKYNVLLDLDPPYAINWDV